MPAPPNSESPTDPRHCYRLQCAVTILGVHVCLAPSKRLGGFLSLKISQSRTNKDGQQGKQCHCKQATITLGRNEFREIMVHVTFNGSSISYLLTDCKVHHRFVKDGKGSIAIVDKNIDILLSNCPPARLNIFLKTLDAKLTIIRKKLHIARPGLRKTPDLNARQRLPTIFEKLSPLSLAEIQALRPTMTSQAQPLADSTNTPKRIAVGAKRVNAEATTPNGQTGTGVAGMKKRKLTESQHRSPQCQALPPTTTKLTSFILSNEQKRVLRTVLSGVSVFFTGAAGTGKSMLLNKIIGALPADNTFVTAATGVAACHVGGVTLHSFAGIGAGTAALTHCIQLASRPSVAAQWRKCKHLIVDEISMIDAEFFTKLEAVARSVRNNQQPFGGIQLILCGDFFQLPPVAKDNKQTKFCFQCAAWDRSVQTNLILREVRRQDDTKFIQLLNEIREGFCSHQSSLVLRSTSNHQLDSHGIEATRLCTHKRDAELINRIKLDEIQGEIRTFKCADSEDLPSKLDVGCPAVIQLKRKAQVMLTKNLDLTKELSNGARGIIVDFDVKTGHPIVQFVSGERRSIKPCRHIIRLPSGCVVTRVQLPLQLAWAMSIHKSQGMSLDRVEISLARVFEDGQACVALSRARSLAGLRVVDFDACCIRANKHVKQFYDELRAEID